jgi:outer membrane protein OmpA-like peptidoglycan-associated protein
MYCGLIWAQKNEKKEDKDFGNYWYVDAGEAFEERIRKGDYSKVVLEKAGDAYYNNSDMDQAVQWYGMLYSRYEEELKPEYIFKYIHALKGVGNYVLAKSLMKIYGDRDLANSYKVAQFRDNDRALDAILEKQPGFVISLLPANSEVADFGTAFFNNRVVFASSRDTTLVKTRLYRWNEQPFLDLYIADTVARGTDFENIEPLSDAINTKYHEAVAAFNKAGDVVYFTRNNFTEKDLKRDNEGTNHLKLYRAKLTNNEWTDVEELPFNSESYSVGQPALSWDEKKLYFVSDMPGSLGATDIYVVDLLEDGGFSEPVNLGDKINTAGREMFPFASESRFYFASDGHLGIGGLDIFEMYLEDEMGEAINLGPPLNSNRDDFAYYVNEENQRGYFSSNRTDGKGGDDIYSFERLDEDCTQILIGRVTDVQSGNPIENARVLIIDDAGSLVEETNSATDGSYAFDMPVDCSRPYNVKAVKEGYESSQTEFNSTDQPRLTHKLPLAIKKYNDLIVMENGLLKIKIGIVYFDFDRSFIRSDAAMELDKVVHLMQEYPNMVIKIESHTDSRGNDSYNLRLSDRRAKSTRDYIIAQGIDSNRLESAKGYGETRLINDCVNGRKCEEQEHDLNRRSEFIILEL